MYLFGSDPRITMPPRGVRTEATGRLVPTIDSSSKGTLVRYLKQRRFRAPCEAFQICFSDAEDGRHTKSFLELRKFVGRHRILTIIVDSLPDN